MSSAIRPAGQSTARATLSPRAKVRLADEYDAAQDRGEVAGHGGARKFNVADAYVESVTAADLGLRRDEIHEARQFRDAEQEAPGLIAQAIEARLAAGQEPTKAAVREAVEARKPFVAHNSGKNEWYTPPDILAAAMSLSSVSVISNALRLRGLKL